MRTKQQAKQAKNLQAAERQHRKDKSDLRETIRLTPDAKLTGKEKRRLAASVHKAQRDGRIPKTAQQTIPYQEICRDGICIVNENFYIKQVQFYDINYQLAQNEDKNLIFENWCDFLNYFDSSIRIQLSFLNQRADMEEYQQSINIPDQMDAFNAIREEYSDMLKCQLAKGNNGLSKTKYITFGVEADDLKSAKLRLERMESDVLANFKALGVRAHSLNGYERLSILHRMFHPTGTQKFRFVWDAIWKTGLSSKDFIEPDSFTFKSGKTVQKLVRDGLVEQNKATGEEKRISQRTADISFGPDRTTEQAAGRRAAQRTTGDAAPTGKKPRKQPRPVQQTAEEAVWANTQEPETPPTPDAPSMRMAADAPMIAPHCRQRRTAPAASFKEKTETEESQKGQAAAGREAYAERRPIHGQSAGTETRVHARRR